MKSVKWILWAVSAIVRLALIGFICFALLWVGELMPDSCVRIGDTYMTNIVYTEYSYSVPYGYSSKIELDRSESLTGCIRMADAEYEVEVLQDGQDVRITYQDGPVIEGRWENGALLDADGVPLREREDMQTAVGAARKRSISLIDLTEGLCRIAYREDQEISSVWLRLLGSLSLLFGLIGLFFPGCTASLARCCVERPLKRRAVCLASAAVALVGAVITLSHVQLLVISYL